MALHFALPAGVQYIIEWTFTQHSSTLMPLHSLLYNVRKWLMPNACANGPLLLPGINNRETIFMITAPVFTGVSFLCRTFIFQDSSGFQ